jgi:hypothetical protein
LLLDEVLAVGDRAFQKKCKERIAELHRQGMTMIFISHDLTAVRDICSRALLLHRGQVKANGSTDEVIRSYADLANSQGSFEETAQISGEQRRAELTGLRFLDADGQPCESITLGQPFTCQVDYLVHRPVSRGAVGVYFLDPAGVIATQLTTAINGETFDMPPGPGVIEFYCPEMALKPEAYRIDICIDQPATQETFEWQHGCASILVEGEKELRGLFHMPHTWRRIS